MPDNAESMLEEALDNLREATQRLRATENRMLSADMHNRANYQDLFVRVSTALAMTEAAFVEAQRMLEEERNERRHLAERLERLEEQRRPPRAAVPPPVGLRAQEEEAIVPGEEEAAAGDDDVARIEDPSVVGSDDDASARAEGLEDENPASVRAEPDRLQKRLEEDRRPWWKWLFGR